jgi:hypothetical protein
MRTVSSSDAVVSYETHGAVEPPAVLFEAAPLSNVERAAAFDATLAGFPAASQVM